MKSASPLFRVLSRLAASTATAATCAAAAQVASPNTPVLPSATQVAPPASPSTPQLATPLPAPAAPRVDIRLTTPTTGPSDAPDLSTLGAPRYSTGPVVGAPLPRRRVSGDSILPEPSERPMELDVAGDPVLALANKAGDGATFRRAVADAVARNPSRGEATAQFDEIEAQRREARAQQFPTVDVNVTSYRVLSRDFANDLNNIVERTRPFKRTDATLSLNQTVLDFGATQARMASANARLRAASAGVDDAVAQIALQTVGAWYDVFSGRVLVSLAKAYRATQDDRRRELQQRIALGANASADISRLDSSVSSIDQRVARFERDLANAEARYTQLTGSPPPAGLMRAPPLGDVPVSEEEARNAAAELPSVVATAAQAEAARKDATAARADRLPNISAGIIAGRYGILEDDRDYDIRGVLTLRKRFFGGVDAHADQSRARANGADARAARFREEAARDAAVAFADLQAFDRQLDALRTSYIAARMSRDTTEERFRVSRGTLFDAIDANDAYFSAASNYIQALAERDSARYILLARTGRLLGALGIDSLSQQVRSR